MGGEGISRLGGASQSQVLGALLLGFEGEPRTHSCHSSSGCADAGCGFGSQGARSAGQRSLKIVSLGWKCAWDFCGNENLKFLQGEEWRVSGTDKNKFFVRIVLGPRIFGTLSTPGRYVLNRKLPAGRRGVSRWLLLRDLACLFSYLPFCRKHLESLSGSSDSCCCCHCRPTRALRQQPTSSSPLPGNTGVGSYPSYSSYLSERHLVLSCLTPCLTLYTGNWL